MTLAAVRQQHTDKHLKSALYSLKLREFYVRFHLFASDFKVKTRKIRRNDWKIKTEQEYGEKVLKNASLLETHGAAAALKQKRISMDAE